MGGNRKYMRAHPLKVIFFANTEWYLFNFRLGFAKYLRERGVEVVMVSPPGPYGEKLEAAGFRWIPVPMSRRSLNLFCEIRPFWRLFCIYRAEKPDIAHHFTIKCVVYGGLAASVIRIQGIVSAVTGLGYVFIGKDLQAKILRPLIRRLLNFVIDGHNRRLIVQNPDDRQAFLSAGVIKNDHIFMIAGSGVNTQHFHPSALRTPVSRPCPKVVFAARLLWDKGVCEFVEASQKLRSAGVYAEFVIAGDPDPGNPASIPNETLTKWQALPALTLIGHVDDMAAFLEDADVMVLPSYYGEGVPRSLIEAAATGLPIVTTNTPGCREIVDDGVNGFLVPVRDSAALAEAIGKILEDPALAIRMGVAGRIKALSEFDETLVFEKTLDVYCELVSEFDFPLNAGQQNNNLNLNLSPLK
jgi:glycosyltransferase involved in cell wall biosynthesis